MTNLDLVRGTLDLLVLRSLVWGPRHGYAVTAWIHDQSGEQLAVLDGALYQALHRLEARGFVSAEWGMSENNRRAKYYTLTAGGRRWLQAQARDWTRYARVIDRMLGAT